MLNARSSSSNHRKMSGTAPTITSQGYLTPQLRMLGVYVCMYVCMHVPIYACIPLTDALHLLHPLTYLFSLSMYSCRNVPMKMTSPIPNTRPSMHGRRGAHVGSPGSVADDSLMTSPKSSPTGAHKRIHIPHTIYHIPYTTYHIPHTT